MSEKKQKGVSNVLQKLEKSVQEGNYYEAQQMYKTIYFRYLGQKKFEDVKSILISGATTMFQSKRHNEGVDLAVLLLNLYKDTKTTVSQETLDIVCRLVSLHLDNLGEDGTPVESFLKASIRWSLEQGKYKEGEPELHNIISKHYFIKQRDFGKAQRYFLRGSQTQLFCSMITEWTSEVDPNERDLVLARAVLEYLCLSNLKDANTLFQSFLILNPNFPETPLVNYLRFLLITLERDALPLFNMLRKKYKPSIDRDSSFEAYVDHIALVFFKVKPASGNNFLGDMLKNLFSSGPNVGDSNSNSNNNNNSNSNNLSNMIDDFIPTSEMAD